MKVLITGSSGAIGAALAPRLERAGNDVVHLSRRPGGPGRSTILWDPAAGRIDAAGLEGVDAVVHLAGENIAGGRWTPERKRAIRESRVFGTGLLAERLAGLSRRPRVIVSASALGWYGDRGSEILTEDSAPGRGFLADVCREWEAAAGPARAAGIRTVHLRIGIVLTPESGALKEMMTPFRWGIGGPLGHGRQWMSWITLHDLVRAFEHLLGAESVSGPVNGVSPGAVTNAEFSRTLARVMRRPGLIPAPAIALKLLVGEMAEALLLSSARLAPTRLLSSGFVFDQPALEAALRELLGS